MKAVIFDMDGVIFDSERAVYALWCQMAEKYGFKNVDTPYYKSIGTNKDATRKIFLDFYGEDFPYDDYKFVSFFSLSRESIITLKGFKYDLEKYTLLDDDNLCISNEIYDGLVKVYSGRVLVIKSKDDA